MLIISLRTPSAEYFIFSWILLDLLCAKGRSIHRKSAFASQFLSSHINLLCARWYYEFLTFKWISPTHNNLLPNHYLFTIHKHFWISFNIIQGVQKFLITESAMRFLHGNHKMKIFLNKISTEARFMQKMRLSRTYCKQCCYIAFDFSRISDKILR
jgi:hypothetical protein